MKIPQSKSHFMAARLSKVLSFFSLLRPIKWCFIYNNNSLYKQLILTDARWSEIPVANMNPPQSRNSYWKQSGQASISEPVAITNDALRRKGGVFKKKREGTWTQLEHHARTTRNCVQGSSGSISEVDVGGSRSSSSTSTSCIPHNSRELCDYQC